MNQNTQLKCNGWSDVPLPSVPPVPNKAPAPKAPDPTKPDGPLVVDAVPELTAAPALDPLRAASPLLLPKSRAPPEIMGPFTEAEFSVDSWPVAEVDEGAFTSEVMAGPVEELCL